MELSFIIDLHRLDISRLIEYLTLLVTAINFDYFFLRKYFLLDIFADLFREIQATRRYIFRHDTKAYIG